MSDHYCECSYCEELDGAHDEYCESCPDCESEREADADWKHDADWAHGRR